MDSNTNTKEIYLSSKEAGQILGYTHDYVSRLCRQGHMVGLRKGREWYVKPSDLELFKQNHEVFLQEKKKQLSQKLSVIRKKHEAQKRQTKAEIVVEEKVAEKPEHPVMYGSATNFTDNEVVLDTFKKEKIKISIPKQLVAVCVLALLLFVPAIINNASGVTKSSATATVSDSMSIGESFVNSIVELPGETIQTLESIGNIYLLVYQLQGKNIYESVQQMSYIGKVVLSGYELIGDSLWFGGKDLLNRFGGMIGSFTQDTQKKTLNYASNVSGGYNYVSEQFFFAFNTGVVGAISQGFGIVASNISQNIRAMSSTVNTISYSVHASMGSIFSISKEAKSSSIRVIPVR